MVTNFFWIGYHFEKFRSQAAVWKKKLISQPEGFNIFLNTSVKNEHTALFAQKNYLLKASIICNPVIMSVL